MATVAMSAALPAGLRSGMSPIPAAIVGVFLWLDMQVAALPFLGWGALGSAQTSRIAVAP